MDSDALDTFLTVHRKGGVSNAARALHRSQPAISRRIALLERELGVPLFERVAGRTRLSDAGRRTRGRSRSPSSARSRAVGCRKS